MVILTLTLTLKLTLKLVLNYTTLYNCALIVHLAIVFVIVTYFCRLNAFEHYKDFQTLLYCNGTINLRLFFIKLY